MLPAAYARILSCDMLHLYSKRPQVFHAFTQDREALFYVLALLGFHLTGKEQNTG